MDRVEKTRNYVHQETTCTYSVFTTEVGKKYFQLDTYGSADRKILAKVSQSIQFELGSAKNLLNC